MDDSNTLVACFLFVLLPLCDEEWWVVRKEVGGGGGGWENEENITGDVTREERRR